MQLNSMFFLLFSLINSVSFLFLSMVATLFFPLWVWLFTHCLDQVNLYLFAPFLCLVQMLHFPSMSIVSAESLIFFLFSLSARWLLLIFLHPQVYYNFSTLCILGCTKCSFVTSEWPYFFFSRIQHRSLITVFLFVVLTCLPSSFGAQVPANGTVSSLLSLCFCVSLADAVSPFLLSIDCFAVRELAVCCPAKSNGFRYSL